MLSVGSKSAIIQGLRLLLCRLPAGDDVLGLCMRYCSTAVVKFHEQLIVHVKCTISRPTGNNRFVWRSTNYVHVISPMYRRLSAGIVPPLRRFQLFIVDHGRRRHRAAVGRPPRRSLLDRSKGGKERRKGSE